MSSKSNEPASKGDNKPAARIEALNPEGLSIIELLNYHWCWAQDTSARDSRASLAMKSNALEKNISLRIDLLKVERGEAVEAAIDLRELFEQANERLASPAVEPQSD